MKQNSILIIQIVLLIIVVLPFIAYVQLDNCNSTNEYIQEGAEVVIITIDGAFYSIGLILEPYVTSELGTAHDLLKSCILITGMLLTAIIVILIARTSSKIITQWAKEQK
jgi:hypothetical protein